MIRPPRLPEGDTAIVRWCRELVRWALSSSTKQIEGFEKIQTTDGLIFRGSKQQSTTQQTGGDTTPRWG